MKNKHVPLLNFSHRSITLLYFEGQIGEGALGHLPQKWGGGINVI